MDYKLCSIGLEMDQNLLFVYVSLYSLIHYAHCRHSVGLICRDGVGIGTYFAGTGTGVMGMGTVSIGTGGDGVQFLLPCRPLVHGQAAAVTCGSAR